MHSHRSIQGCGEELCPGLAGHPDYAAGGATVGDREGGDRLGPPPHPQVPAANLTVTHHNLWDIERKEYCDTMLCWLCCLAGQAAGGEGVRLVGGVLAGQGRPGRLQLHHRAERIRHVEYEASPSPGPALLSFELLV